MSEKKYLVIKRGKCIGCGSCVAATQGKCDFVDSKVWCVKEEIENAQDIADVCPVDAIVPSTSEEYDIAKEKEGM